MDKEKLEQSYKGYSENVSKWNKIEAVYNGNKRDLEDGKYLILRSNEDNRKDPKYLERKKFAAPVPLLSTIVEAYLWRLRAAVKQITIDFGPILSSHEDRLLNDINGRGDNLWTIWLEGLMWDILFNESYSYVDGPSSKPTVHNIHPRSVIDKGAGWVKIKDRVPVRDPYDGSNQPWMQEDKYNERYTIYTADKLIRYVVDQDEDIRSEEDRYNEQIEGWTHRNAEGDPILPISTSTVPTKRDVMESLADVNLNIFNKKAFRDYVLMISCTPKGQFVGTPEDYKKMKNELSNSNIWTIDPRHDGPGHGFITAPMDGPQHTTEVLKQDIKEFSVYAFREIESSVRKGGEKTATAVNQEAAQGQNTFLYSVLNAGVEKLTNWFTRLENHYDPQYNQEHGQFTVDVSDVDFKPIDHEQIADRFIERYGRMKLPVGEKGYVDYVKTVADSDGLDYDERELEEQAREKYNRNREQNAFGAAFGEGQI